MTTRVGTPRPYVVRALDHDPMAKLPTMTQRRPAINADTVGSEQICMAYGVSAPGTSTGAHTHGETETAAYVLSGTARVYFGEKFEEYIEGSAGDFVFVPAHIPHVEVNISGETATFVVARSSGRSVVLPVEADLSHLEPLLKRAAESVSET